ncbi:hypothetical protein F5B20DRAFT_94278 [Whalleya microplaca]|nr:hypothetical protein F5B20DRAFT_94278 [Whalleya microplaca]
MASLACSFFSLCTITVMTETKAERVTENEEVLLCCIVSLLIVPKLIIFDDNLSVLCPAHNTISQSFIDIL